MELSNPGFWLILLAVCLFMLLRQRAKRGDLSQPRQKQLTIRGQKIKTVIDRQSELGCLLQEGMKFGEDFMDKEPPELPHGPLCRCEVVDLIIGAHDLFTGHDQEMNPSTSDLGRLDADHLRYYKFALIARHPDADEELKEEFRELMTRSRVEPQFKERVEGHLSLPQEARPDQT